MQVIDQSVISRLEMEFIIKRRHRLLGRKYRSSPPWQPIEDAPRDADRILIAIRKWVKERNQT